MEHTPVGSMASSVAVLIPAAGSGTRMGGERKQFRRLGGDTLLVQTVRRFCTHPEVEHLTIAAPADSIEAIREELASGGLGGHCMVVEGGSTRQASVARALHATPPEHTLILVHDAVRPFVQPEEISAVIAAARLHGAAALAIPVTETMRRASHEYFLETVARHDLYRMQTPQAFRRDWLERAHVHADKLEATDDVEMVQGLGYKVHLVPGSSFNIKITTPDDWAIARALWDSGVWERHT